MYYFEIIFGALACVTTLIFYSDRTKYRVIKWVGIIAPPLLLIGFYKLPKDLITAIPWLIAGLMMAISAIHIIWMIFSFIFQKFINSKKDSSFSYIKFIRPGLCVLCFFFASSIVNKSVVSANEKAIELAFDMKEHVLKTGKCIPVLDEWLGSEYRFIDMNSIDYGEYGTEYRIYYSCEPKYDYFEFNVRIDQDSSFSVVFKQSLMKVSYGHYANMKEVEVDDKTDLKALAQMKAQ